MKKIFAFLMASLMVLTFNVSSVSAASTTKGVVYYNIELKTDATLTPGTYFLSTDGTLADANFVSFVFPDAILNACVEVTAGLDTSTGYYGKDDGNPAHGIDGYPVDVIKKDQQFDGCMDGHIFAPAADIKNGVQTWRYYCNYSGAQNKGPYYLYSVKTATYDTTKMKAKVLKDMSGKNGPTTITTADLEVSVEFEADGKKFTDPKSVFLVDPTDNTVDFAKGDYYIKLMLEGDTGTYFVTFDMKNNVFLPDGQEPSIVAPAPTPKPAAPASPKTGMPSSALPIGIIVLGLGALGVLEVKRRKTN